MGSSQTLSINSWCSSFVLSRQEYQPYLPNNLPQDCHNGLRNSLWDNHPRLCMWVCMYHQLPSSETGSCFLCRKLDKVQFGRTHICVCACVCVRFSALLSLKYDGAKPDSNLIRAHTPKPSCRKVPISSPQPSQQCQSVVWLRSSSCCHK